jgi:NADP-reducing hydrogenase subunit HndB
MAKAMSLREGEARARVTVHMGTCGIAAGARKIMSVLMNLVEQRDTKDILLTTSGCAGLCSREPMITVELRGQAPVKYISLDEAKTKQIFEAHVLAGKIVQEHALAVGSERVG